MEYQIADIKPHITKTGKTMHFLKLSNNGEMTECSTMDEVGFYNAGDKIEGDITVDGKYTNFHLPKDRSDNNSDLAEIKKAVSLLMKDYRERKGLNDVAEIEDNTINIDDIPF
jgi:hypothetical protein